jgi:hypothetical protein
VRPIPGTTMGDFGFIPAQEQNFDDVFISEKEETQVYRR